VEVSVSVVSSLPQPPLAAREVSWTGFQGDSDLPQREIKVSVKPAWLKKLNLVWDVVRVSPERLAAKAASVTPAPPSVQVQTQR
jgi:hypothetical protein